MILTITAYKFVTTTTFDKEFKKLDKSIQKIIAKYIKINLINSTNPFLKGKALTANLFLWIFWGQRADKILEDFFTTTMTDTERWDYIENYFLGKI